MTFWKTVWATMVGVFLATFTQGFIFGVHDVGKYLGWWNGLY
jgi:hypothetical protein